MIKIKNKDFKALIDKLMQKELESLRKRFRPYKRRPFLNNNVIIDLDLKFKVNDVVGYYENTPDKEKQWRVTHKIFITRLGKELYERYAEEWYWKNKAVLDLKMVIRHELIHAFVFEEFDQWESINNCNGDYSPIFLSCLYWGEGDSGHEYVENFKETDLYKKIKICKKFDNVNRILADYIFAMEKAVRELNKKMNADIQDYKNLNIEFNTKGAGILKKSYVSLMSRSKQDGKLHIQKITEMTLGIGFLVTPEVLMQNYDRKFGNGSIAKSHSEMIAYFVHNEFKQKRVIKENFK